MAQVERVFGARVAMQAHEEHVRALVEEALRPVAVVVVHIQHRHAPTPLRAQRLRRHGGVVQEAVAAHEVGARMVARWTGGAEHGVLACAQQPGSAHRCIGTGLGRRPGAGAEGRTVVHRVQAQPGGEVRRLHIGAQAAHGPHRGEGLAIGVARLQRQPVGPGAFQKSQVAGRVDQRQHRAAVGAGLTQHVAACHQLLLHEPRPRR